MILLTGASGFVGKLMAAILLARHDDLQLFLPYRNHHSESELGNQILQRARDLNPNANLSKTRLLMKPVSNLLDLLSMQDQLRNVQEIIHSAGSVSYDDEDTLLTVNVELTR